MKDIFSLKNIGLFLIGIIVIVITFFTAKIPIGTFFIAMIIKMFAHDEDFEICDAIIRIVLYSSIFLGALSYVIAFYFGWISPDWLTHFHPSLIKCMAILALNCFAIFTVEVIFCED
jgi:hypothetical protein